MSKDFMPNVIEVSYGWYGVHDNKTTAYVRRDIGREEVLDVLNELELLAIEFSYYKGGELADKVRAFIGGTNEL